MFEMALFILLVIITGVAMLARRVPVPYTVALVVVGLVLAIFNPGVGVNITSDLILLILVPPLIFESALHLDFVQTVMTSQT